MPRGKPGDPGSLHKANVVNAYLETLRTRPTKRARSEAQLRAELARTAEALTDESLSNLRRLDLVQKQLDLTAAVSNHNTDLEDEFVAFAREWSEKRGTSYAAWRAMGVPAAVLDRAGITQMGRKRD